MENRKSQISHWQELGLLVTMFLILSLVRLPGIFFQSPHQDEYFTLLEVAGNWLPDWSREITTAGQAAQVINVSPSMQDVTDSLRTSDHPPLYYWTLLLWRRWLGYSLEIARGLSLLFSVGSAIGFYGLLRFAGLKYPWIIALVYGFSSQIVFWGQNTRNYSFANFFVISMAYFAYRAVEVSTSKVKRSVIYDLAMVVSAWIAFGSNYFALFSVIMILAWYGICVWKNNKWRVIYSFLFIFMVYMFAFPFIWQQYLFRGGAKSGYLGIRLQILEVIKANYSILYSPFFRSVPFMLFVWCIYSLLIILTFVFIVHRWETINRKFFLLIIVMTITPSLAISLVNFIFDKSLTHYRYLLMAGPGLTIALSYGLVSLLSIKRKTALVLLGILFLIQFTGINWGVEKMPRFKGSHYRSLAKMINGSSEDPLVVVGSQVGRGHPVVLFDELDIHTDVLKLSVGHDPYAVLEQVYGYEMIWFIPATQRGTGQVDQEFLRLLRMEGDFDESEVLVGEETHYIDSRWFERVLWFRTP